MGVIRTVEQESDLIGMWEQLEHPLSTRDDIGFIVFKDRLWVIGSSVVPAGASGHEVFSTADGINWTEHGPGNWVGQRGPTTVVLGDYVYIVGNAMHDDVYRTSDPGSGRWEKVLVDAPWGKRHGASVVVFDDKMWLMGGMRFGPDGWPVTGQPEYQAESFNDIWMSEDGINWTLVAEHAPWGARAHINGGAAVLNGKMYVYSGGVITLQPFGGVRDHVGEPYRDVWSTTDGVNWTLETEQAPWTGRTFGSIAVYQDHLILMGGSIGTDHRDMDHDFWMSKDGKTWVEGSFPGLPRHASGMIEFQGDLYIAGGLQTDDVWRLNGPRQSSGYAATEDAPLSISLTPDQFDYFAVNATVSAQLSDGGALPSWLTFDPDSLTLSGTPENNDVGSINIVVKIIGEEGTGSALFPIVVANVNDAPIADVIRLQLNPDAAFRFGDPSLFFRDPDADDSLAAIRLDALPSTGSLLLGDDVVTLGQVIATADLSLLRYVPAASGSGADVDAIEFTTFDAAGAEAADPTRLVMDIVAAAPLGSDSRLLVQQGETKSFAADLFGFSDPNEGDGLGHVRIDSLPSLGTLTFDGAEVTAGLLVAAADLTLLSFKAPIWEGDATPAFQFTVLDQTGLAANASATFLLEINRPPVAQDVTMQLRQDRLFMPSAEDFPFADADGSDMFQAIRIESVPELGRFLLNGVPITPGTLVPAWKLPQIAYIPAGTVNRVHQVEFAYRVQDSRGAFSEAASFRLVVDTVVFRDVIAGTDGNDQLVGDDGNNQIEGGGGDDLIIPGYGDDVVSGGDGRDTASFAFNPAGIRVTLGPRTGQATGDGVKWLWDVENVIGGAGNDIVIGDGRDNRLDGLEGNDTLYGEDGHDLLLPGSGDDYVHGGSGIDTVSFEGLDSDVQADLRRTASGTAGAKSIVAVENLTGGNGNDHLTGDAGANRIEGGAGNDTLFGGSGDDVFVAGSGNDIFAGEEGIDTVTFAGSSVDVGARLGLLVGQGTSGGIKWFWGIENLIGGTGNDYFIGDSVANRLVGGSGNDRLYGEGGDDLLLPGLGTNLVHGGGGVDTVSFEDLTADVVAELDSTMSGGEVSVTLHHIENVRGGAGNDRLVGNSSGNRLEGGDGNDLLIGGRGDDILSGGHGNDTASFDGLTAGIGIQLGPLAGQATSAGIKWLWSIENVIGTAHSDYIIGDSENNRIMGGPGGDRLYGEGGDDILLPGTGSGLVHGGAGIDTLSFEDLSLGITGSLYAVGNLSVSDVENFVGSSGNDHFFGDRFANRLDGGAGNDVLNGSDGDDFLIGGQGQDTLTGGRGADTFLLVPAGADLIFDFVAGEDRLAVSASAFGLESEIDLVVGIEAIATMARGQFLYDINFGTLHWDSDGTGDVSAIQIAQFAGVPGLTASDFFLLG